MKNLFRRKNVVRLLAVLLLLSLFFAVIAKVDFKTADADSSSPQVTEATLDEYTRRTQLSDKSPQISVFIHGFGGNASHWTNDGNNTFAYDEDSMPEQLRMRIGENNANVMVVKPGYEYENLLNKDRTKEESQSLVISEFDKGATELQSMYTKIETRMNLSVESKSVKIFDCPKGKYPDISNNNIAYKQSIMSEDVNKHLIVILDLLQSSESNDFVYAEMEYCLDTLSYQYKSLTGELPTYNLIAHSRGGLTAMQYALAHPFNVASIFTMGTPYNGCVFGQYESLLNLANIFKNYEYTDLDSKDYAPGVLDIMNKNLYESYKTVWNNNYNTYFSHINFSPIGSYVTLEFIFNALGDFIERELGINQNLATIAAKATSAFVVLGMYVSEDFCDLVVNILSAVSKEINFDLQDWLIILRNLSSSSIDYPHIGVDSKEACFYRDDLFIDLDSQIATGYNGTDVRLKKLTGKDQSGKKSINNVGVGHNLETRNKDIINYVVSSVDVGVRGDFDVRFTDEGYFITNYKGTPENGVIRIPSTYQGYPVVGIDALCRDKDVSGDTTYLSNVKQVNIPSSIEHIGNYAFFNMPSLTSVTFSGQNNIEDIGDFAFALCKSLTIFEIGKQTMHIGISAFGGTADSSFSVDKDNAAYVNFGGTIYSKNYKNLVAYPTAKNLDSFIVHNSTEKVCAGAFFANSYLKSVNLSKVIVIEEGAFTNCVNLSLITADNLLKADLYAFSGTRWLAERENSDDDFISLGNVLLKYKGTTATLELSGYKTVGAFAFAENEYIETVDFKDCVINEIGDFAFYGCSQLKSVSIRNYDVTVKFGDFAFDADNSELTIYVLSNLFSGYLNENQRRDDLTELKIEELLIKVSFIERGGNHERYFRYGEIMSNISGKSVENEFIIGYIFKAWLDESTGRLVVENDRMWHFEDYRLIAQYVEDRPGYIFKGWQIGNQIYKEIPSGLAPLDTEVSEVWEMVVAEVQFNLNGGTISKSSNYNVMDDRYQLPNASRQYYRFNGWTYRDGTKVTVATLREKVQQSMDPIQVYANWIAVELNAYYVTNGGSYLNANIQTTFSGDKPIYLQNPTRDGYIFKGWYADAQFNKRVYQITLDIVDPRTYTATVYAKWAKRCTVSVTVISGNVTTYIVGQGDLFTFNMKRTGYTVKIYEVGGTKSYNYGDSITIYGDMSFTCSWTSTDMSFRYFIRSGEKEHTDDGYNSNYHDTIKLSTLLDGTSISTLKAQGYKSVTLTITFDAREVNDGYQYVSLRKDNGVELQNFKFEHVKGKKDTTFKSYQFEVKVNIDDINTTNLYIYYNASGSLADNWINKNVAIIARFSEIP